MEAVKAKNSIHDFRSELNQIAWSRACSFNEYWIKSKKISNKQWILDDNYKDSRTKVIGKAIGDCVAGEGAFKDKTPDQIITFERTNPETYGPENWNAVILYNYVHEAINGAVFEKYFVHDKKEKRYYYGEGGWNTYTGQTRKVSDVLENKLEEIKKYYQNKYNKKLEDAVNDIQKYVDALELNEWLADFRETEMNYRISDLPLCSDLAPYLSNYFSEHGGPLSRSSPFYRVDDEDALNKRLSYGLELRYHDRNLYVWGLEIEKQSFEFENGKGEWKRKDGTSLSDLSELKSPEFQWIMDRLEGLVTPPSEELWNEWCQAEVA